jgi:hypothetical protein
VLNDNRVRVGEILHSVFSCVLTEISARPNESIPEGAKPIDQMEGILDDINDYK